MKIFFLISHVFIWNTPVSKGFLLTFLSKHNYNQRIKLLIWHKTQINHPHLHLFLFGS